MKHPALTILLPTYNEADNIVLLLKALLKALPDSVSFLVLDDRSPDNTAMRVETFIQTSKTKRVTILVRPKHPGLTNSLRDGIRLSRSDWVGWMDCDFSHPPDVMRTLFDAVKDTTDIVIASRFAKGGKQKSGESKAGAQLSSWLNTLCRLFFGSSITDYTTGFLIAKKSVLTALPLRGSYGEYCIDFLVRAKRKGYTIEEVPFISPPRRFGTSKTAPNIRILLMRGVGYAKTFIRLIVQG